MSYDHFCPKLSPNSTRPNMRKVGCSRKIRLKVRGCPTCPQGVGYVKPVRKVITERLWKNPNEKKQFAKKVRKQVQKNSKVLAGWRERDCACGNKRELKKTYCEDCRVKNLAVALAKTRLKFLLKQRDKLNTKIANVRELIKG